MADTLKKLPLRCRLGWHTWTIWGKQVPGMITLLPFRADARELQTPVQERECALCHRTELRVAR